MHHGQRRDRGAGPEPRAAGGTARRPLRPCGGAHHQHGVRIGSQGGDAGRAGNRGRRHRYRRRRRDGIDEQLSVSPAARARGSSDGQRRAPGFDDHRRPLVRVRSSATWATPEKSSPSTTAIGREAQDEYAARSHQRALQATEAGWFKDEILPVSIPQRKGPPTPVDRDEPIRARHDGRIAWPAHTRLQEGRIGHGRQRARRERRRVGGRGHGGRPRALAGCDADGADRRAGHERPAAEVRPDDAGRSHSPRRCRRSGGICRTSICSRSTRRSPCRR